MKIPRQILRRRARSDGVAATVAQQSTEAADLARIPGQHRLTDPRTNPAVRTHADRLRNAQHRRALDAEHGRLLRRHRVDDRRAAHAEQALNALQQAREASSAAKSVLALHAGRTRFMGVALAASLSLSYGAATGVAEYAERNDAPWQAGYLAEVGFTGLSTAVILYRSHLAQHGSKITGWQDKILWLLMIAPLAASMAANLKGAGPVGVACSVGAAAFSFLSYVIADLSATAIQDRARRVSGDDENDLRVIASGEDLFTTPGTLESGAQGPPTWFEILGLSFSPAPARPPVLPAEPLPPTPLSGLAVGSPAGPLTQGVPQGTDLKGDQVTPQAATQVTPDRVTQDTAQVTPQTMAWVTQEGVTQAISQVAPEAVAQTMAHAAPQAARKRGGRSPSKPRRQPQRRTDAELIAELDEIVAEHYRNGGGEIEVKPIAARLGIGRDRARRLLAQMNVRPIRKVAN